MRPYRLTLDAKDTIAALNIFSLTVDAFPDDALAAGRLMATYGAFGVLRAHSQQQNRKIRDLAAYVAETGALPPG